MISTHDIYIYINKMVKLIAGQGYKVKGKGQKSKLGKSLLTIYHEPMIESCFMVLGETSMGS